MFNVLQRADQLFDACQHRLVWATERVVESYFLDSGIRAEGYTLAWLIEKGAVTVEFKGESTRVEAGEWYLLPSCAGIQHFESGTRLISIWFDVRLRGGMALFDREAALVLKARKYPKLKTAANRLVEQFRQWVPTSGSLMIGRSRLSLQDNYRLESAFLGWLAEYIIVMRENGNEPNRMHKRDSRVVQALTIIEDWPQRAKFSEKELAQQCGLSLNQMNQIFKEEVGISPYRYYQKRLLELARHALSETDMQIKEIAFELGFNSSPHFSNWFLSRGKMTPREYRSRIRMRTKGSG